MALVKAQIRVESRPEQVFTVLFNPEEYSLNKDNNFASQAIPGLSSPLLQFVHGNLATLEMELLFDTYDTNIELKDKQDVRDITNQFIQLMTIDSELHAPPILQFSWGSLNFRCVLARANQKFILFSSTGNPVRARINATFNEYKDLDRELKELNLQSTDLTKAHVVTQGETLSSIAAKFYKNAEIWRPIAIANGINDPRSLYAGQALSIPSLPFTNPATGEVVQ